MTLRRETRKGAPSNRWRARECASRRDAAPRLFPDYGDPGIGVVRWGIAVSKNESSS